LNDNAQNDPRLVAIPDIHGHAKGEHKAFIDERPIPLSARMLFLWFYHACRRGAPRFLMVSDHMNYLTFEDPAAINLVRRALKLAQAGDLYGAAETASVEVGHAAVVSEGLRRGMRYSIGAEVDNDPRSRPDAQNIVDAMRPDGMIRSVHFLTIDHPTHGPNWNWPFDNPEFTDVYELVGTAKLWELYMATLLDAIERLPGNIVGHFYVPALFGHWPHDAALDAYEDQLVDACEARGMAIELNTRFLYREHSDEEKEKYLAAYRRLLAKCKAKNVGVAVGSDAHSPKDQGSAFATVLGLLDECEINELVFPIGGRLARVALRVERKVEPAPEPPAPATEERKAARRPRPVEPPVKEEPHPITSENGDIPKTKPARPKRSKVKAAEAIEMSAADRDGAGIAVHDGAPPGPIEPADFESVAEPAAHASHDPLVFDETSAAVPVEPEAVQPEPEAVQPEPEAVQPEPEAVQPEPEAVQPEPEAVQLEPEAVQPESTAVQPEPEAVQPEPEAVQPEPEAVQPESTAVQPEPEAVQPESTAVQPEPEASAAELEESANVVEVQEPAGPAAVEPVVAIVAEVSSEPTFETAAGFEPEARESAEAMETLPEDETPATVDAAAEPEIAIEIVEVEVVDESDILVSAPLEEMVTDAEFERIVSEPPEETADAEADESSAEMAESWPDENEENVIVVVTESSGDSTAEGVPEVLPAARKPRPKTGAKAKAPAAKRSGAKPRTAVKKAPKPAVKSTAKKVPPKPVVKKAGAKTGAEKAAAKKTAAKKAAPKKAAAQKAAIRASGTKKVAAKKAAAKKATAKKPAQRRH
jgi:HisJ family histidinol phosphate phosphatase